MTVSRSTPRLRLTAALLAGLLLLVAVSARGPAPGLARELLQMAGFACLVLAALGRLWCSVFIAGRKDRELVIHGPYSALRHPLYALSMLGLLGIGLTSASLAITAALLATFAMLYRRAARAEDTLLAGLHGAAFERYRATVPAFLPRRIPAAPPEVMEVQPRVLWKAFLDAGSLLGYALLLRLADALQLAGATPTWLHLP
jgi:protein-S-isoprenylcysteine O-methyltransferase Ste14